MARKCAAENGHITGIATIGAMIAERSARRIERSGAYAVVARVSTLRNSFPIVPHGTLHRDSKNAILLEPTICGFAVDNRVSHY